MKTFNLELTLAELQELHVSLFVRKDELRHAIEGKNKDVAEIAMRQLERVAPICYYVESVIREHHANK